MKYVAGNLRRRRTICEGRGCELPVRVKGKFSTSIEERKEETAYGTWGRAGWGNVITSPTFFTR